MTDAELQRWQLYIRQRVLIDPVTGCWLWQLSTNAKGYGKASGAYHQGLDQMAHRLAYTVFVGPIPEGLLLRHQCHNKPCCNPVHLLVGTEQDNKDDDKRDGIPHSRTVLTEPQIAEIKRLLALRIYSQKHIGLMFGVTQVAISHIATGKRWSHIPPATTESKP